MANSAATLPVITVSDTDFERIEQLLESPAARQQPGLDGLRGELARARIVAADEVAADTVTMNSIVSLIDELSGEPHVVELVYPPQADGSSGRISVLAPMGSAVLGLSAGQSIEWQVPGGKRLRLKVLDVRRRPAHRPH